MNDGDKRDTVDTFLLRKGSLARFFCHFYSPEMAFLLFSTSVDFQHSHMLLMKNRAAD